MQIILQHRASGLFVGEGCEWVSMSRDARKFANGSEAVRFAEVVKILPDVRMVVRYEQNDSSILLPLMGRLSQY